MEQTDSITAIFWDYENVRIMGKNLNIFLTGLELLKIQIGGNFYQKCFNHWKNIPKETQLSIADAGFELCQVPETRKNAVDQSMIISAVNLTHQNTISHFILITSDGDFTTLCQDLQNKKIKLSIISRKEISLDLKQYSQLLYFVSSGGLIFQFERTYKAELFQLLEQGIQDAKDACKLLIKEDQNQITVFSKSQWKNAYKEFKNYRVSPYILSQILKIDEFYKLFLKKSGYGVSKDFNHFCFHSGILKKIKLEEKEEDIEKKIYQKTLN